MISFVIQRTDTGQFYKYRPYGNRWETQIKKAKRYSRLGDASNAITLMRQGHRDLARVDFVVSEYSLSPTGRSFPYLWQQPNRNKR